MKYTDLTTSKSVLDILHWRKQAVAFGVTLVIFTILGPFDTYTAPVLIRVAHWGLSLLSGWVCLVFFITIMLRNPRLDHWSVRGRVGVSVSLASVPIWLLVSLLNWQFYQRHLQLIDLMHVLFSCAVIAGLQYYLLSFRFGKSKPVNKPETYRFFERIPVDLGRDLISISTQDHYVEVRTKLGSKLILLRFSDALEELAGFDGIQIHRSHWVALKAVQAMARQNGKLVVNLHDGRALPVSRTYAPTVKAALAYS